MLNTVAKLYYVERERFHRAAAASASTEQVRHSHLALAEANALQIVALSQSTGRDPAWA